MTLPQQELSRRRNAAASRLDQAVAQEFGPLRLERARFVTAPRERIRTRPSPHGIDRVEFQVAVNPGHAAQPLDESGFGR